MQIDNYMRKELVKEIRYCANKIMEEKDPQRKMYFLSYCSSVVGRVMEFNYDRHLSFMQFVLELSASTISTRVEAIFKEEDGTIPLAEDLLDRLVEGLNELATKIEKDEETHETLEKIVQLAYITTETGHYQHQKGQIRL